MSMAYILVDLRLTLWFHPLFLSTILPVFEMLAIVTFIASNGFWLLW